MSDLATCIDHTLLRPDAVETEILEVCREAVTHGFAGVCVATSWLPVVAERLAGTEVRAVAVAGFPLGASATEAKAAETEWAVAAGAREVDVVIHLGHARAGRYDLVEADLRAVVDAAAGRGVKAILETASFEPDAIRRLAEAAVRAGVAFVKTSTGFGAGGASVEAVRLLRETVGPDLGVKASGGIRTAADARAMVAAGATRIGASASVAIIGAAGGPSS